MPSLQQKTFLANLFSGYPESVRVSHNLADGLFYAPIQQVLDGLFPYCSVNPANSYNSIVLDYDKNWLDLDWDHLPLPNVAVINPKNNHAHLFYVLRNAVHKNPESSGKALKFLADTVERMTFWTGADLNFTGVLGKNAFYDGWTVVVLHQNQWTLATLSDWFKPVPKETVRQVIAQARVESRNCAIFDTVRAWAYKNYHRFRNGEYQAFLSAVLDVAQLGNNLLKYPMMYNEVKGISKSIAKWTWQNIYKGVQFMAWSKENGKKGAKKSLAIRKVKSEMRAQEVVQLKKERYTQREIAEMLGISSRQVRNYLAAYKKQPTESPESPDQLQFEF